MKPSDTYGGMAAFRLVLGFVVGFTLVGIFIASAFAPRFLAWDNTPAMGAALCNCADVTRQTADKLINLQLTGGATGAIVGLVGGAAWTLLRKKKPAVAV